jgi:hypothetical protein
MINESFLLVVPLIKMRDKRGNERWAAVIDNDVQINLERRQ